MDTQPSWWQCVRHRIGMLINPPDTALKDELAAAQKDAARYRWLRDHDNDLWITMIEAIKIGGETMEAAIDKEMAKK